MKTPEEKIVKMQELYKEGYSVSAIAEMLKMGNTTVRDNIKKLNLERPIDLPPKFYVTEKEKKRIMDKIIKAKEKLKAENPDMKVKF